MRPDIIALLPDQVCFTLAEAGDVLTTVDLAVARSSGNSRHGRLARRVRMLITERLWPELGALLQDESGEEA